MIYEEVTLSIIQLLVYFKPLWLTLLCCILSLMWMMRFESGTFCN